MYINEHDKVVRHYIYDVFSKTAKPPTTSMIAKKLGMNIASAEESLKRLAKGHHIALAPGSSSLWMAHPFSGIPTDYITKINGNEYSGN